MLRIPRHICTLFLAIVVIVWMRSYHFAEGVELSVRSHSVLIMNAPGRIHARWPSPVFLGPLVQSGAKEGQRWDIEASSTPRSIQPVTTHGPVWIFDKQTWLPLWVRDVSPQDTSLDIAIWLLALPAGLWPAWTLLQWLRRRWRLRSGTLCRTCEYDLRATPKQCPECGMLVRARSWRRSWSVRLLVAAGVIALFLCGHWLTRHDFRNPNCQYMDFATLGGFTFDQEHGTLADIPLSLRHLDGQRISIEGYMIPMDPADDITEFALVPTLVEHYPVLLQQNVVARIINGKAITYFPDRVRIYGTLHVRVQTDDGYVVCVYDMTVDSAKAALKTDAQGRTSYVSPFFER